MIRYRSVEPVNGAKPRVASTSKYDVLASVVGAATTMLCPAQGHPLPAYRYLELSLLTCILESRLAVLLILLDSCIKTLFRYYVADSMRKGNYHSIIIVRLIHVIMDGWM